MERRKVRVGVVGAGRGRSAIQYCATANNAEIVAICDLRQDRLDDMRAMYPEKNISYYTEFEEMLNQEMDVVVLAHGGDKFGYAIKAMERGLHVISELMPVSNMKEAVELIEAVERTGQLYMFAENYCYQPTPWEMKRLYREGEIGELEYAEAEYVHEREHFVCENPIPAENNKVWYGWYAHLYGTHCIGPMLHITGLRPIRVIGFEHLFNNRQYRLCCKAGGAATSIIELSNGAYFKVYYGNASATSHWHCAYGSKGRMESERVLVELEFPHRMYLESYPEEGHYDEMKIDYYFPKDELTEASQGFQFSGGDYRMMWHMMERILGNPKADTVDVYEAMDMFLPCLFGYRSVLAGNTWMEIPDLRDPVQREKWRNDTACTQEEKAGDMLLPTYSRGEIVIDDSAYDHMRSQYAKGYKGLRPCDGLPRKQIMLKMKEEGKLW